MPLARYQLSPTAHSLAKGIKLVGDYEHTTFTGGTATGDREAENFVATRVQYSF